MAKLIDRPAQNTTPALNDASAVRPPNPHPLDSVIGIFRDEPLMDALMERVRQDRRAEQDASEQDVSG